MKVEGQNYYVQKKSAFKVDGTLRIETVRTTLDFAYRMTFSGEGQHRIHRSGGEHNRRNGEIFANAYQGKLAEFAACNYFCRFDKTIKPDLTIMKLGKWDSSDLSLNGCEISVKSTKKYGQLLLLETRDWTSDGIYIPNEGHGTASYDCILLIRMEPCCEDILRNAHLLYCDQISKEKLSSLLLNQKWHYNYVGFITKDDLRQVIHTQQILPKGARLNGKMPMDAENYYVQAGDLRPLDECSALFD